MKITINIDCTPKEARSFFGLPDLGPMQKRVLEAMEEQMMSSMSMSDPEAMMKAWMPLGQQGMEQMQRFFTQAMASAAAGAATKKDE